MHGNQFRLIAPPHSPFRPDGGLNITVVDQQAELLKRTRVDGVFVTGTSGECAALTIEERRELAGRWVEVVRDTNRDVIVQVGDNCQANAMLLAAHAQRIGADAIAAHAPSYFKPADVDSLIDFLAPIAAAAADLPFYFYDIPCFSGVRLPMGEFLDKGKLRIPNLVGLKYSNTDLVQLQECLQRGHGEFEVLFGCDEILLAGIAMGVHGAVGSTYNFAAPLYRRMLAAFSRGDLETARACQLQSAAMIRCMSRLGFIAASKYAMSMFGVDCGPVRPPLRNLSVSERDELRQELEQLDAFQIDSSKRDAESRNPKDSARGKVASGDA